MQYTVRRLTLDDMDRAAFIYQCVEYATHPPDQFVRNYFAQMLYTHNEVWGAVDSDIVGFIAFGLHEDDGYIEQICVLPKYQRRGIGAALISVAKARRRTLEAWTSNAMEFYRKRGFVHSKTVNNGPNAVQNRTEVYKWTALTSP